METHTSTGIVKRRVKRAINIAIPLMTVVSKASGQAQTEDSKERERVLSDRAGQIERLKRSRLSTDINKSPRKSEELDK